MRERRLFVYNQKKQKTGSLLQLPSRAQHEVWPCSGSILRCQGVRSLCGCPSMIWVIACLCTARLSEVLLASLPGAGIQARTPVTQFSGAPSRRASHEQTWLPELAGEEEGSAGGDLLTMGLQTEKMTIKLHMFYWETCYVDNMLAIWPAGSLALWVLQIGGLLWMGRNQSKSTEFCKKQMGPCPKTGLLQAFRNRNCSKHPVFET